MEEGLDSNHWRNWISTGDVIQLLVMIVIVSVSYAKQSANVAAVEKKTEEQSLYLQQMHEALDQFRTQRTMTPEAAQRIAVLETRIAELDERNSTVDMRLQRIEDKLDSLRNYLRK